ncbi:MAG: aminoglycoside 6-adenylyltransferase [[Eubacterium] siraeum]
MNRYDELMKRLLAVCKAQPEIKAVIIVGSQAREISKADEYSDLDLIIAFSEPQILLYENNIIGKLGKPVYSFVEDTFAGEKERRILFEKSLDVGMIVMSEDSLVNLLKSHNADFILNRGFSLCYDACGISQLICKSSKITPVILPLYQRKVSVILQMILCSIPCGQRRKSDVESFGQR